MCAWKTVTSKVVFETPWITIKHDHVITPSGSNGEYGLVEFKNRAVGVVPILDDGRIVMVRQTRYAISNQSSLEIPEGGAPYQEDWLETAKRELKEETGFEATNIEPLLTGFYLSNSVTNEQGALFVATGLTAGESELEETEDIQVEYYSFDSLLKMIQNQEITDSLTIMGLMLVQQRRNEFGL